MIKFAQDFHLILNRIPLNLHNLNLKLKLHSEELNDLYSSPNIVRLIKSRRMRWAGHAARMEEGRGVHKVFVCEA